MSTEKIVDEIKRCLKESRPEDALQIVDSNKTSLRPATVEQLKALIMFETGQPRSAEVYLSRAIAADPSHLEARMNLARVHFQSGRKELALKAFEALYGEHTDNYSVVKGYVNILLDQSQVERARDISEAYLRLHPDNSFFKLTLASSERALGNGEQAIRILRKYLDEGREDAFTAYRLLGDAVGEADSMAALQHYETALKLPEASDPKNTKASQVKWNMSLHLLRIRDFARGWAYWQIGLLKDVGTMGRNLPEVIRNQKCLSMKEINPSEWVLLITEQGLGDQILFMSAFEELLAITKRVILVSDPRMLPIWSRSWPDIPITTPGILELQQFWKVPIQGYLPMGSILPGCRPSIDSFKQNRKAFLKVKRNRHDHYKSLLSDFSRGRTKVGISWRGGHWGPQKRAKSLDFLSWKPLFESGCAIVNLQYGKTDEELNLVKQWGYEIFTPPSIDYEKDLDEWLALSSACDLIISVSTALVHFCGAVGQKTIVIMPHPQGPWTLGIKDKKHLVYPSVSITRPRKSETIDDLMGRIAGGLKEGKITL